MKPEVNYPKRRPKNVEVRIVGLPEPNRESLYDVMMKAFKIVNRTTFIHRLIYTGEHTLPRETDELSNAFSETITEVNEQYHLEKISGFLLLYAKCFIHMVEGDEDSIHKHIKILLQKEGYKKNVGTVKLLICVHHINQRFQDGWTFYNGVPSKLFKAIDADSDLAETGRIIYTFIKKMYNLVYQYITDQKEAKSNDDTPRTSTDESCGMLAITTPSHARVVSSSASFRSSMLLTGGATLTDPYRHSLPEYEVVAFLIKSKFTQPFESYYQLYRVVPQRVIYKDRVWPIPSDFVPYDVFAKVYDHVTELPRERVEDFHSRLPAHKMEDKKGTAEDDAVSLA